MNGYERHIPREQFGIATPPDFFTSLDWQDTTNLSGVRQAEVQRGYERQPTFAALSLLAEAPKHALNEQESVALAFFGALSDHIVAEDDDLLVVSKPPLLPVHYTDKFSFGVEELLRLAKGSGVHHANRIDADTSGVVLFTKNWQSLARLTNQFAGADPDREKIYKAILDGAIQDEQRVHIFVTAAANNTMRVATTEDRRDADTRVYDTYTVFTPQQLVRDRRTPRDTRTLVDVDIYTGRKHQIRVIAAQALNAPLLGDPIYNGSPDGRDAAPRTMLHASRATFVHPTSGERVSFQADLPADFRRVLNRHKVVRNLAA